MNATGFSKQAAIGHGFYQTQKFIGFIILMGLVLMAFKLGTGLLDHFAGKSNMTKESLQELKLPTGQQAQLFEILQEQGFITEVGLVTDRLRYLEDTDEVELPPTLEPVRADILKFLDQFRYKLPFPRSVYFAIRLILWFVGLLLSVGYIKICLQMSRDQKPRLSELFDNIDLVLPYLLGSICYGLALIGGFLLLIIPGIILAIMFQMYGYLIIDKGLGPIESLKRSRVITKGSRWNLALFAVLLFLCNVAGLLCLGLGLIWSIPTTSIAMAHVYDQLENGGESGRLEDIIRET